MIADDGFGSEEWELSSNFLQKVPDEKILQGPLDMSDSVLLSNS